MVNTTKKLLACSAGTLAMMAATPTFAQDNVDEVVATGIRASLNRGLDVKRNEDSIVDAISAEELGKFPDTNVAESLQRITGIAITRSRGGEGQFVTVRGLGQEFNTLTYKGRELATENQGREFSFDVIPSELISAAQVFKTTTASQTDGSIGGLVNIETARALNNPGFHGAGQIAGQYESLARDVGFKASGVLSNTFANDTIGVIASASYQKRDFRTDTAESIGIGQGDVNGDGVSDRVNTFSANLNEEERERLGLTLAVEYEPNENTSITIDGLYTSFESPSVSSSFGFFPGVNGVTNPTVDGFNDALSITANFADFPTGNPQGQQFANIFDTVARRAQADTDTFQIGGNWKQNYDNGFSTELDASYSNADGVRDNIGSDAGSGDFFVVGFAGFNFRQEANGGRVPDTFITTSPNGVDTLTIDQLTPDDARLHFSRASSNEIEDEIFTIRGDLAYDFSDETSISVGFDFIDREKTNEVFENTNVCGDTSITLTDITNAAGGETNAFFCDRSIGFADLLPADQLANLFAPFDGGGATFLGSSGAIVPTANPLILDFDTIEQAFINLGQAQGTQIQTDGTVLSGTVAELSGVTSFLDSVLNTVNSNTVEETVISGYVQGDFTGQLGGVPFKANAGLRATYTDVTSIGASADLVNIVLDPLADGGSGNNDITVDQTGELSVDNDYFDLLPSFNISFDLQENLKLRTGFSRSLSRPTFNDLSTVFAITQFNEGQEQSAGGNPLLEAVTSNNVDASLEWYGDNGLSLTGAVFYKDINNFITNANSDISITIPNSQLAADNSEQGPQTVTFQNSGPLNGDTAEIYGIEVAGQYLHSSGFGISGNVTLADSNSTSGGQVSALENISDFSGNASIFYENYGIQARASLNHRGEFLASTEGEGGFQDFTDAFTQVDLSLSYDVTENITVFGEGQNVLNEQLFTFSERDTFLESFIDNGARWLFGVRGSF